jgi:uncharacterized protein
MRKLNDVRAWCWLLTVAAMLLTSLAAQADVAVPPLKSRVTDLTSTLSPDQSAALEQSIAAFEARKGSQIAVLIVPTTQPETIEQYSIRVVDAWKLGRKGIDDGVLLLVAKDDRDMRIEVGRGLEGALTDIAAKRIEAEYIVPRFREGDYAGGISAGVDRIMKVIDGEPLPPPKQNAPTGNRINLESLLLTGFVLIFVVGGILRAIFGRFIGSGIVGGVIAAIAWVMAGTILAAVAAGLIAFVFSLFGAARGVGGYPVGGWSSRGGWGSGGFGGGGFGGGGFSGGGGGFSGGGASSRW